MQPLFKQHLVAVILVKVAEDFGVFVLPDAGRDQLECTVSILNRAQKPAVAGEIFYGEQIISMTVITHIVCLVRFVMHRLGTSWGFHWDRALRRRRVRLRAGRHWRAACRLAWGPLLRTWLRHAAAFHGFRIRSEMFCERMPSFVDCFPMLGVWVSCHARQVQLRHCFTGEVLS